MLVLRPLRPGRDQVRELEPSWRRLPAGDPAVLAAHRLPHDLAAHQVLAYVVEIEVDGWRVTPGRPVLSWGFERDVDAGAVQRVAADEGAKRLIQVLDHHPRESEPRPSATSDTRAIIGVEVVALSRSHARPFVGPVVPCPQ